MLDNMALKVNQALIILFTLLGFILNLPVLVAFTGLVMLLGTIWPKAALFKLFYGYFLRRTGLLKPEPVREDPNAPLFAQGVGAIFLVAASLAFLTQAAMLGWVLTWIVIVLAAINLFFGFCVGCFVYFQLAKRGVRANLPSWPSVG